MGVARGCDFVMQHAFVIIDEFVLTDGMSLGPDYFRSPRVVYDSQRGDAATIRRMRIRTEKMTSKVS